MSEPTVSIQDVMDYIDFLNNAKKLSNMYKESFEAYIKDKSLPLELRWQLWVDAPSEMKNRSSWIERFVSVSEEEIKWDWFERREKVDMKGLVEMLIGDEKPQEIIEAFMEEILEKNLESFRFDW